MSVPHVEELIRVKRDGGTHEDAQLEALVAGYVSGKIPDYQMSAWLMAAFLNGLDAQETIALTAAMARTGETIDLSGLGTPVADKHSTGGVGDKTTLVVAPLVAACGVPVAKMSGRGLGHTGGTLDKLEAIPGFRVEMDVDDFVGQVSSVGLAVIAQSAEIDPADKMMYALRDVTATVPSIPLIVASIVSKKVAGGADVIVLDVKVGSGAFMKTDEDARELADALSRTGEALDRRVASVLTNMDEPLGWAVGNAIEVREALDTLAGDGPDDLVELSVGLAARMVGSATGIGVDQALAQVREALVSGEGLAACERWIEAQGGDPRVVSDRTLLPAAPLTRVVEARSAGYVGGFATEGVGRAAMVLGAGRLTKDDVIDPSAGIVLAAKVGDEVAQGEPVATLHAATETALDAGEERFLASFTLAEEQPARRPVFREM